MDHEFTGEVIEWRGPAPYFFALVPPSDVASLREAALAAGFGWGMAKIRAELGSTAFKTALWSRDGGYLVPLKDAVRKPAGIDVGDEVTIRFTFETPVKRPTTKRAPARRPRGSREPVDPAQLTIVPANQATWEDLEAIFAGGDTSRCWCQRFRMLPGESWASEGPEELSARLRDQTSGPGTTGLVAYLDGEPVGWCAVAPRAGHPRLLRDFRVPWQDRTEDKTDPTVWAVTCFVTRAGYRRRGIATALAAATVDHARRAGAGSIEGYPDLVDGGSVGTLTMFTSAGYTEVSRPGNRRVVMRIDF
ncbi:GNAT family N-acetyltransferase [Kribbella sp. NPDC026611]|uniref:GNAT family N-acetyltransferase n=1 Tax=Kribbella sp. NPDC026611 TaxID=3154911 RepID=UPI0034085F69